MSTYQENRQVSAAERETILVYGLLVLLIGGGIGVYFPLLIDKPLSADSLATYALAALAPLWTDILLPEKYWKTLSVRGRMRIGAACGFAALLSFAALVRNGKSFDMTFAILGTLLVLLIFYHVSVLSARFEPGSPPSTEDGGPNPTAEKLGGGGLK
jgi:hypothetical protein